MAVDVLLGLQWGDEGKGKIVDYLTPNYEVVARFQGGPNAGHTLKINGQQIVLHTVPSGVFNEKSINLIGNGVVIDPVVFQKEIDEITSLGVKVQSSVYISKKAHLILPSHKVLDEAAEKAKGKAKIGSTLRGIGPAYMDKTGRNGLRVGEILTSDFEEKYSYLKNKHLDLLKSYNYEFDQQEYEKEWMKSIQFMKGMNLVDGEIFINGQLNSGKKVLAEGAQGSMLDIDFGTYPFVTSSNTISSGACIGLGLAPQRIKEVIGISKAYCTRVGNGPFPTESNDADGEKLAKIGNEFGATTGRPRRCGWIDLPALKYAIMLNGVTQLILTKVDVLNTFETIKVCTHYEYQGDKIDYMPYDVKEGELTPIYKEFKGWNQEIKEDMPEELNIFLDYLEQELDVSIRLISIGPEREQILERTADSVV